MSERVLRDVVTKMALDPAFATVVNTKPSVALRHVDLSVPEGDLVIKLSRGGVHRRVGVADINVPDVRRRLSTLSPAAVDKLRGLGRRPPAPSPPGDGAVALPGAAVVGGLRGGGRALQGIGQALQEAGTSVGGGTGQLIAGAGESLTKFGDALDNLASTAGARRFRPRPGRAGAPARQPAERRHQPAAATPRRQQQRRHGRPRWRGDRRHGAGNRDRRCRPDARPGGDRRRPQRAQQAHTGPI